MGCGGCPKPKKKPTSAKKRRNPSSINPFLHFLKCVWKKFKGCKRSVVVRYAVKKWKRMSKSEKQPFYELACRAEAMNKAKKDQTPKPRPCPPCPKPCPPPPNPCPKPKCRKKVKKPKPCPKC